MKTINYVILLLLFNGTLTMSSCKKDEKQSTTKDKILGKWSIEKVDYVDFEDGVTQAYTESAPGEFLQFDADGKGSIKIYDEVEEFTWQLIDDKKIFIPYEDNDEFKDDDITLEIKSLTSTNMVLYSKEIDGADYYEMTIYLKR